MVNDDGYYMVNDGEYLLVGGFSPSEKYESNGSIIPNVWNNIECSKPPTSIG